jgi:hypothetical protein
MLVSCSKSDHFWGDEPEGNFMKGGHNQPVMVTLPFKADFVTYYTDMHWEQICRDDPEKNWLIIVDIDGTATHLGKITGRLEFCCDISTGVYKDCTGSFIAANGDQLFINS